ncbi:MAG: hypothetical protein K0S61_547 [Anaerocolumna sp.]|jgi:hypothetical protein|nr:hypothetical protein [Anaerocolumna sp.]
MKKLIFVILITTISLNLQHSNTKAKIPISESITTINVDETKNDLVYRRYDTGIRLTNNSKIIVQHLNSNLKDETAIIYVMDLENNEIFKLCDYLPNQNISYTPFITSVYSLLAVISNGDYRDITHLAIIESSISDETSYSLILLQ